MKKYLFILATLFPFSAMAVGGINGPSDQIFNSPDTLSSVLTNQGGCGDFERVEDDDNTIIYFITNCANYPSYISHQIWPPLYSDIQGKPARTFNYPSRSLNSCFQISSSNDAEFHYKVDVNTGLSLTSGAQGTVTATSYTNSSCTTGAQSVADGTASQTGTLVVGLNISQVVDVPLDGTLPAGKWLKITTANTTGTPTFTIRSVQAETILP